MAPSYDPAIVDGDLIAATTTVRIGAATPVRVPVAVAGPEGLGLS